MATFDELVDKYESNYLASDSDLIGRITGTQHIQNKFYENWQITFEDLFIDNISQTDIRKFKDMINEFVDNGFAIVVKGRQDEISGLLKEDTVGDKGAVKQIARNDIPATYDAPNPLVEYVYLPDSIDVQKQKFLTTYKENLKNISGGLIDDINLQPLYPGGPLFTKSAKDAENLKIVLKDLFNNPISNAILRSASISNEVVGGGRNGTTKRIYKGGVAKYFSKIQQDPVDGMRKLIRNPGYTIGLFTEIDGEKIPVSLIYEHTRGTNYSPEFVGNISNVQGRLDIQHSILDTNPNRVEGFFPDPYYSYNKELNNFVVKRGGDFSMIKNAALKKSVTNWFLGMLRTADLANVTLTNSPANAQVAKFYQLGGFIFKSGAEEIDSGTGMIRYPDPTRPTTNNSLAKVNIRPDFRVSTSGIKGNIYGSPDRIDNPRAKKNKKYPNILDSERHRALIRMYNVPEVADVDMVTQAIFGVDIGFDGAIGYSRDNPTKYILNEETLNSINRYAQTDAGKKHIIKTFLSSDYLQNFTGINPETITAEEKDLFEFKQKTNIGTDATALPYKFIEQLQETGFENIDGGVINLEQRSDLSLEQVNEFFFTEGLQPVTDTPSTLSPYTADGNVTTRNLVSQFDTNFTDMTYNLNQYMDTNIDYSDDYVGAFVNRNNVFAELNVNVAGQATQLNKILDNFTYSGQGQDSMTPNNRPFISDEFRHRLTTNMRDTMYLDSQNELIALDVEYVGRVSSQTHAIEIGTAYFDTSVNEIKTTYSVYHVIPSEDNFVIDGVFFNNNNNNTPSEIRNINIAFSASLEEFVDVVYNPTGPTNIVTPTWRVAETMGITSNGDMNYNFDVTKNLVPTRESAIQQLRELQQTIDKSNEPRNFLTRSPQTFYTNVVFNDMSMIKNTEDLNKLLDALEKYTDELSIANFEIEVFDSTTEGNVPILRKIHKQPIELLNPQESFELKNNRIISTTDLEVDNVELRIPSKDLSNGVFQNYMSKIQTDTDLSEAYFYRANSHPSNIIYRIDDVGRRAFDLDNLDLVFAPYTLGSTTTTGDIGYYGPPHNATRVPVGSSPDISTIRQLGRSFTKTKTGKALGTAWKTIDIGETIISKAFAKAQQAALAAGAVGLGAAAAFTAKVWALYEIGNLLLSAGQQIPELYNVIQQRNETLKNGEEWEKQIVEETFWQDYGPQFLEALERAGDRSPAELLSNEIWSFTLNNLRQQSEGQIFEDDLEENFDTMDDIYYSPIPGNVKLEQMQNNVDYDKVFTGYLNNVPEANVIANRTFKLANEVYNR